MAAFGNRPSFELDISELYWIVYQAGTHEYGGDRASIGLDAARFQAMVMNFVDALPSLTPAGKRELLESALAARRPDPCGSPPASR